VSRRGDTLIDYACGKGGDFPKWISSGLSFVFGIDISRDNLENRLDGACARFLNYKRDFKTVPYALFVHGNSGANIKTGKAMLNEKAVQITRAVFGEGAKTDIEDRLGKAVERQFGKGEEGFNVSSCQFALHYFFQNQTTFQNFLRNVSECTKLGGYFVGACYDGKLIFDMLKKKNIGESIELFHKDVKIWEVRKDYDMDYFEDDASSLGYQISVYQESINKMFPEFLVNFSYMERVMENYGFKLITRDEAKAMGVPDGSGFFSDMFSLMQEECKRTGNRQRVYGSAQRMTEYEKKISFLNRYFIYKKTRNVLAEKVAIEQLDEVLDEERQEARRAKKKQEEEARSSEAAARKKKQNEKKRPKSKSPARKLKTKLVLMAASEAEMSTNGEDEDKSGKESGTAQKEEPSVENQKEVEQKGDKEVKVKKSKVKKIKLKLDE
jgi:hypothetical protein